MSELAERWRALLADGEGPAARRRAQGTAFYRSGRVAGLRLTPGRLSASVQGARATPYHVEVLVPLLDDADWGQVVDAVAGDLRHVATLLAGRWPDELLDALAARGVDLLGEGVAPDARCPCGEADRPCAHLVALWEAAAARFEDDPFALLHLRGRGRQRFLADLSAARRGRGDAPDGRLVLDALAPERWTRAALPMADLEDAPAARAESAGAPLRLLGDPPGWAGTTPAYEVFAPLVDAAARYAGRLTRGEPGDEGDPRSAERRYAGPVL